MTQSYLPIMLDLVKDLINLQFFMQKVRKNQKQVLSCLNIMVKSFDSDTSYKLSRSNQWH